MIGFNAALIGQKHVTYKQDGGVRNQRVIVSVLDFFGQLKMLFGHFEKHFNIPSLAISADNLFIGLCYIGCSNANQPFLRICLPVKALDGPHMRL